MGFFLFNSIKVWITKSNCDGIVRHTAQVVKQNSGLKLMRRKKYTILCGFRITSTRYIIKCEFVEMLSSNEKKKQKVMSKLTFIFLCFFPVSVVLLALVLFIWYAIGIFIRLNGRHRMWESFSCFYVSLTSMFGIFFFHFYCVFVYCCATFHRLMMRQNIFPIQILMMELNWNYPLECLMERVFPWWGLALTERFVFIDLRWFRSK